FPQLWGQIAQEVGSLPVSSDSPHYPLYEMLKKAYSTDNKIDVSSIRATLTTDNQTNIIDTLLMNSEWNFSHINEKQAEEVIQKLIIRLKTDYAKQQRQLLQKQIAQAEAAGDHEKAKALLQQFSSIS